jgi:predicted negative regulator of RcsB-dependent stress response
VDEYLSEKEQIEQLKQWWHDYGWYLLGGAALALAGLFGYNQYRAYQEGVVEEQAALYQELREALEDDDRQVADNLLARLASEHGGSAYLDQARMLVAEDNLIRDTDRAISELEAVVAQTQDASMVNIARLRLARVLAYDEQYERALTVLNVADSGEFEARFSEVRGDIHSATGNLEAAMSAYTEALLGSATGGINRDVLQLKLNDLLQSDLLDSGDEG